MLPTLMTLLIFGSILVPLLDQAIKLVVRDRLGSGSISLGVMGQLRVVQTHMWMVRAARGFTLAAMWILWIVAASALATISALAPSLGGCSGLLLGGSLSHAVETSLRGSIDDYVCLRFWPAFNLADVALTVGALGMVVEVFVAFHHVWS